MAKCFYPESGECTPDYCDFMIEGVCRAKELEELASHKKWMINPECFVW